MAAPKTLQDKWHINQEKGRYEHSEYQKAIRRLI
jgi:hypothetical protein